MKFSRRLNTKLVRYSDGGHVPYIQIVRYSDGKVALPKYCDLKTGPVFEWLKTSLDCF